MKISEEYLRKIVCSVMLEQEVKRGSVDAKALSGRTGAKKTPQQLAQDKGLVPAPKKPKGPSIVTNNFTCVSSPPAEAVSIAKKEAKIWETPKSAAGKKRGYIHEDDKEAKPLLKKYFDSVKPGFYEKLMKEAPKAPWSAGFVTYCLKHSDGEAKWQPSANHQNPKYDGYLYHAWQKRKEVEANPEKFVGQTLYLAFSGKEVIGNGKSNKHSTIKPSQQKATKVNMLSPGDVVGIRQSNGEIHMDIFVGNNQIVGGNTGNQKGARRDSCGFRSAKLKSQTDVIKRVKITKAHKKQAAT